MFCRKLDSFIFPVQSKKRGLSLEEKREKMLQIFYDSQDFYLVSEARNNEYAIVPKSTENDVVRLRGKFIFPCNLVSILRAKVMENYI